MNNKILAGTALSACALIAWAAKEPVVMTVNGVDVPRSEFEYLYHKNTQQQQLDPQPIEEYAEMFKLYKMKVADALAEKLDTAASFRKEMEKYRHDLAEPFLADSVLLNSLVAEAADRAQKEVEVRHIMLNRHPDPQVDEAVRQKLDSIRGLLLQGQDFTTLAKQYSQDQSAKTNGGNLGFFSAGRLPYEFEKVAWSLPEGEVSEIVESPMNYHIIYGGAKRPSRGKVHVSHILKMCRQGSTPEQEITAKAKIDSIYAAIMENPMRFEAIALAESDDKGSGQQGGLLPWFGAGEMVAEFDAKAFSMSDGEICAPIRTPFGWHIIKRINHRDAPTAEELKPEVLSRINNPQDERYQLVKEAQTARLEKKFDASINDAAAKRLRDKAAALGVDSLFFAEYSSPALSAETLYTINKKAVPVSEFLDRLKGVHQPNPARAALLVENYVKGFYNNKLIDTEIDWLLANEPDYANLYNEYRDGSLLYEVSLNKVWNRASQDTEGLENYFRANRDRYTWDAPHAKGILVQAANDSVAGLIRARMDQLGNDTVISVIRKEFPRQAKLDRVLAKKGDNTMVDYLMFGGPEVEPSDTRYTVYFMYQPRIIEAPEEAADVRGKVTNDYQNQLEAEWKEDLIKKYPVKVNKKELKKIK